MVKEDTGENCITFEDGQKLHDAIVLQMKAGEQVTLDFSGVKVFASPFFNAAVGQLLAEFDSEQLNRLLTFTNLDTNAMAVLRRVISNSKRYYQDDNVRKAVDAAIDKVSE